MRCYPSHPRRGEATLVVDMTRLGGITSEAIDASFAGTGNLDSLTEDGL